MGEQGLGSIVVFFDRPVWHSSDYFLVGWQTKKCGPGRIEDGPAHKRARREEPSQAVWLQQLPVCQELLRISFGSRYWCQKDLLD